MKTSLFKIGDDSSSVAKQSGGLFRNAVDGILAVLPAPEFRNPEQAQFSGEVLEIPDERLVEIALYFKGIFDNICRRNVSRQEGTN